MKSDNVCHAALKIIVLVHFILADLCALYVSFDRAGLLSILDFETNYLESVSLCT